MSRKLDDLLPEFRQKVFELLARCVEQGLLVMIIDTLRTKSEQKEYLKKGTSWTTKSKHLVGKAIDICPIASYMGPGTTKLNWDDVNSEWGKIGEIGEKLGLRWGGRWKQKDLGHFELP